MCDPPIYTQSSAAIKRRYNSEGNPCKNYTRSTGTNRDRGRTILRRLKYICAQCQGIERREREWREWEEIGKTWEGIGKSQQSEKAYNRLQEIEKGERELWD